MKFSIFLADCKSKAYGLSESVSNVKDLYLHNKEKEGGGDPPPQTILAKPDFMAWKGLSTYNVFSRLLLSFDNY